MAAAPLDEWVAALFIARRRSNHHLALLVELAEQGHWRAALAEVKAHAELEHEIDTYVQLLQEAFSSADDVAPVIAIDHQPKPAPSRRRKSQS